MPWEVAVSADICTSELYLTSKEMLHDYPGYLLSFSLPYALSYGNISGILLNESTINLSQ